MVNRTEVSAMAEAKAQAAGDALDVLFFHHGRTVKCPNIVPDGCVPPYHAAKRIHARLATEKSH
jgi:hypothetical protein